MALKDYIPEQFLQIFTRHFLAFVFVIFTFGVAGRIVILVFPGDSFVVMLAHGLETLIISLVLIALATVVLIECARIVWRVIKDDDKTTSILVA
jgi:hypothetical protein